MRLRVPLFAVLLLLGTVPGCAAGTWYDHYLDARDKHIPQKRWDAAHASLKEAIRLKPESALQAEGRTKSPLDLRAFTHEVAGRHGITRSGG